MISSKKSLCWAKLVVACVCIFNSNATWAQEDPETQDRTDPKLEEKLGPLVQIAGYQIRTPRGYEQVVSDNAPKGVNVVNWSGEKRPDGTAALIQVMILTPPPGETLPELPVLMEKMLRGIKSRRSSWEQSKNESEKIADINFLRVDWNGSHTNPDAKMYGIILVAIEGNQAIVLKTQDVSPHHEDALPTGLKSLLSFEKSK